MTLKERFKLVLQHHATHTSGNLSGSLMTADEPVSEVLLQNLLACVHHPSREKLEYLVKDCEPRLGKELLDHIMLWAYGPPSTWCDHLTLDDACVDIVHRDGSRSHFNLEEVLRCPRCGTPRPENGGDSCNP